MGNKVRAVKSRPVKHGGRFAYFNRELSWLSFNRRVLEQAQVTDNPLMERLKFLAIVSSNLDEFFEIRVAGLIQQVESGVIEVGVDGLGPKEQLRRIHDVVGSLVTDQYRCFQEQLTPALAENGIFFLTPDQLTKTDLAWINRYFREQVSPVLTPLAIDPAHPFPQITNKTLNVLVCLDNPETPEVDSLMAILPVPRILPRLVRIEAGDKDHLRFVFLSDVIKLCAAYLFPGYRIHSARAFRITRNSDLYIDEEEAENFLEKIEEELKHRQKGAAVRLEIEVGEDDDLLHRLLGYIDLPTEYVFRIKGPLNLLRLMSVYDAIDRPDLKYKPFQPALRLPSAHGQSIFRTLSEEDILLHHPFDSFAPVVEFVQQAAKDPHVFAIKQTLYRTSGDSPIVRALMEASRNGKQVTALVELKARFDEANNIQWAKQLEEAGVHVVYGMVGFKIHCKCSLVVRREGSSLRRYAHLGTGNYNPNTARLYTDLSFFTAREDITAEVALLFNTLTGFALAPEFNRLHVAPYNLHDNLQKMILTEAQNAEAGKPARIIAKLNSLVDQTTIDNLYRASQAGVEIDLILRGTCCLVPGIPGLSQNIRVRSIVGRFLEHSRIYYFLNHGGESTMVAGSADWMPRNFFRRIEVIFPLDDPKLKARLLELLDVYLRDTASARILQPNGAYRPASSTPGDSSFSAQAHLLQASQREDVAQQVAST
jgi:polyphosphate kinase